MLLAAIYSPLTAADAPTPIEAKTLFNANCAVCHRPTGVGTPGLAPPLTDIPSVLMSSPEGRRQLAMTVLYGMYGEITVDERRYNFKMPAFSQLDDEALAALVNYVSHDLAHVSAATTLTAADLSAERSHPVDGAAVRVHRAHVLSSNAQ
jgi:hypothetical protein